VLVTDLGASTDLSRRVAEAYLAQRQRLEYPFLDESPVEAGQVSRAAATPGTSPTSAADLLVEVGTEELPAGDLDSAVEQLLRRLPALLDDLRLPHGEVQVMGTPRRLVMYVKQVAPRQADLEQLVKGPPADRAFDAFGEPTKAGEGFARSKGMSVHDLQIVEMDGGRYVAAAVRQSGRPAPQVLGEALPGLLGALRFDKSMRWNRSNVYFSRPIRWLLALFGEQTVGFEYAGLQSANVTRGLRTHEPAELTVRDIADYFNAMQEQGIILEKAERLSVVQHSWPGSSAGVDGDYAG
jgi:glycyl-tRNA synthetase